MGKRVIAKVLYRYARPAYYSCLGPSLEEAQNAIVLVRAIAVIETFRNRYLRQLTRGQGVTLSNASGAYVTRAIQQSRIRIP